MATQVAEGDRRSIRATGWALRLWKHRWSFTILTGLLVLFGCDTQIKGSRFGGIEGRVVFVGPVAQAPVELVRLEDGRDVEVMATGVTDQDGRFTFRPLVADFGVYRVRVDLSGLPWRVGERTGIHPRGLGLSATLTDYDRYAERELFVSAYTTLADAVAESLRPTRADADERARSGWVAHLDLDPAQTEIGEPLGDVARDPTLYRLLADAFDALAPQLSTAAGLEPAYFNPGQVLNALLEDARGTEPPGVFDGLGPAGTAYLEEGIIPLDPEALRHHLADGVGYVVANVPAWSSVSPSSLSTLVRRLRCSASSLFPACDPGAAVDPTPPVIDAIDPAPETPLSGVVDIEVRAHEPDGVLSRVDFILRFGERRVPLARLPGPGYVFRLDTASIQGTARVSADVVVVNGAGLETVRAVGWPLVDREVGTVSGQVHKGLARRARVRAFDLTDPPLQLGESLTAEDGTFSVQIVRYSGPIRLEVSDDPAAAPNQQSVYDDEVRGERRWRSDRTLEALVPEFRSGVPQALPYVVTPFTDMALARARRAVAQGELLVNGYESALTTLADQLGLGTNAEALMHTVPSSPSQPALAFEGAEKLAFALGCFSAQAENLAKTAFPNNPDAFDALDLVALYRADLAADPYLDGMEGNVGASLNIDGTEVRLPADPFRNDFVGACARWMSHPANGMALSPDPVIAQLRRLGAFTSPVLYNPAAPPQPFDASPPDFTVTVIPPEAGEGLAFIGEMPERSEVNSADVSQITTVDGTVTMMVEANDPTSIDGLVLGLDGDELPEDFVVTEEQIGTTLRRIRVRMDTNLLTEGRHFLRVQASDLLGNLVDRELAFVADHTAPEVRIDAGALTRVQDVVYTNLNEPQSFQAHWSDFSYTEATVRFVGGEEASGSGLFGAQELAFVLALQTRIEGVHPLELTVTDRVGHTSISHVDLHIDRQAPTITLVPTTTRDEFPLTVDRNLADAPEITLDENGGLIRRWQTSWTEDTDNPASIDFAVVDPELPGQSPPELLVTRFNVCLSDGNGQCQAGTPPRLFERLGPQPSLQFTAGEGGTLPFDPIEAPPAPGPFRVELLEVEDAAGNLLVVGQQLDFTQHVVPPPVTLVIDDTLPPEDTPEGVIVMERLDIAGGDLARLLGPEAPDRLLLRRIVVQNENPIAVTVRVDLGIPLYFRTVVSESFEIEGQSPYTFDPPVCGNGQIDPSTGDIGRTPIDSNSCEFVEMRGNPSTEHWRCNRCINPATPQQLQPYASTIAAERALVFRLGDQVETANIGGRLEWRLDAPPASTVTYLYVGTLEPAAGLPMHQLQVDAPAGAARERLVFNARFYDRFEPIVRNRYKRGSNYVEVESATIGPLVALGGTFKTELAETEGRLNTMEIVPNRTVRRD